MAKKKKSVIAVTEEFQAMIAMIPKLEAFIKIHNEIVAGYRKYRKNGGASIPGIEKHIGVKEVKSASALKEREVAKKESKASAETKAPKEGKEKAAGKNAKKKAKI